MNNDLISRSALLNKTRTIKPPECNSCEYEYMRYVRVEDVWNASGVDAEVVRHGRWIHCNGKSNLWYCSECGEKIIYNPTRKTYKPEKLPVYAVNKRCRSCGAKMDAEVQDDA